MPNPVVHFEIGCKDLGKADQFYTSLFGWSVSQMGPARMIATGAQEGIQGHFTSLALDSWFRGNDAKGRTAESGIGSIRKPSATRRGPARWSG